MTENPEIAPYNQSPLIFDKGAEAIHKERTVFQQKIMK
jgi:hypothetical protein